MAGIQYHFDFVVHFGVSTLFKFLDMLFPCILLLTLLSNSVAAEDIKEGDGYRFHYQVDSQSDNVHFKHNEDRRGYQTIGSYKTLLPDGRTQLVEYTVLDKDSGYVAKVSYQGVATEGKPQYGQPRFKGIKREIAAGSYAHMVKIKPYGRDIEHHNLQVSDIYTTILPTTIENVTVIPSPELVTIATKYAFDLDTSSQEQQQEGDSTTGDFKNIEDGHRIHFNITDTSSVKSDDALSTETTKTTRVVPETTEPGKVIPLPEIVTKTSESKFNEEKFNTYDASSAPEFENLSFRKENLQSYPKETYIIPPKVNKQTKINKPVREQTKKNENVQDGTDPSKLFVVSDNANVSNKNPKLNGIKHNSKKEQPTYEYKFKPIKDKTALTKAETKNKALYQTNFTPKSHNHYVLQKTVNNHYRKPKYALPHKKHDKQYFPFHLPLVSHTRRRDGYNPPKNVNVIKIKKSLQIPILNFKDWFPFKL